MPRPGAGFDHAYYRLYAYVRPDGLSAGWDRDRVVAELTAAGVPAFEGSCSEVYLEKAFDGTGLRPPERLPVARELGATSIAFLVHPTLTGGDLERMAKGIAKVLSLASARPATADAAGEPAFRTASSKCRRHG